MIQKINTQISAINDALAWIKKNKPDHYETRYLELVEERRKLRKIAMAESDNPGIAAFGKSQVGKSYLMSSILQKKEYTTDDAPPKSKPFMVKANGKAYNFIDEMNPITDNTEATGVVTRLSSFSRDPKKYSPEYPVMMKTLSVPDIILIMCDGYFNDIENYTTESEAAINEFAEEKILKAYSTMPVIEDSPLQADDILNIKNYFKRHINNAQAFNHSTYFDKVALVVDRIPSADWEKVFSVLWNKNKDICRLFNKCIGTLRSLCFASEVYLPVESVLHEGQKPNTIMSVDCLKELFDDQPSFHTDAYLRRGDTYAKVEHLTKSEVCAVCAEVVFKIEEEFLTSYTRYITADMAADVQSKLTKEPIPMAILKKNDLLDFPGARSREQEKSDSLGTNVVLINVFLRGKVAYLFNKYNEASAINVLLYCHDQYQNDVTNLYILLDEWVKNYVGDTPEKRQKTIENTGGIAPLFYIATKFNMDLAMRTGGSSNTTKAIDGRWDDRFEKVLYKQCFHPKTAKWVENWTAPGVKFKNSFLLRDFKYSGPKASKLYKGYEEQNQELPREAPNCPDGTNSEGYVTDELYQRMRSSFTTSPSAAMLFEDRALAWDVAASRNNDGTAYIIEKLSTVAERLLNTRESQFQQQLNLTREKLMSILNEYHVSEDSNEILMENIRKANAIIREMDFTCNEDNYFFGHLLQALQITETECLQLIHYLIQSGEMSEQNNNFKDYELILKRCHNFNGCQNTDECWERLQFIYGLRTREDAEEYLAVREIDQQLLFSGSLKKKLNSTVIADRVFGLWHNKLQSVDFRNNILANQRFDDVVMSTLLADIRQTSNSLNLNERMAEGIAEYVNVIDIFKINESLIADILSSTINAFVIDMGYSMLTENDRHEARKLANQYQLPIFDYIDKDRKSHFDEDELTVLFNELTDTPKGLTSAFEDNYYSWLEYMYVSFIAHLEIPDYDHEANEALGKIIQTIA